MNDFTLALVQHASPVRTRDKNLEGTIAWARKAKKAGADLVCFPELGLTGHAGHPAMVEHAEPVPGGPAIQVLANLAAELALFICAGIAEEDLGIHYNTQFFVGPEGYVGKQRKIHLSGDEYFFFRGGTDIPVFDLPFGRVGIVICYDNNMPEPARCLAVKGAEVILAPHAARSGPWRKDAKALRELVQRTKDNWKQVHSCRALDNGTYVALCNTAGRSAMGLKGVEANHAGGCMVFDPYGHLIAESGTRDIKEEMIVVPLKAEPVFARRRHACFNLQTRRPEAFAALTEPTA